MTERDEERDGRGKKRVKVQFSLTAELWERMRQLAERNRRNYSNEAEIAFEEHLERDRQRQDRR